MTLFKKVFSNHVAGGPPAPRRVEPEFADDVVDDYADDFDPDFAADDEDEISARVAALAAENFDEDPGYVADLDALEADGYDLEPEVADEPMEDPQLAPVAATPPPPAAAPVLPDPRQASLAERAAEAQREIERSRLRMSAERPRPAATDRPLAAPSAEPEAARPLVAPPADAGRPGRSARRVRTRLLGFDQTEAGTGDPFATAGGDTPAPAQVFPTGWFVVVGGPGRGHSFAIFGGVSSIGRGDDQAITLDFGDTSISREKHAMVAYDDEANRFYLGHGGKSNIVRLNDRPVLSTEDLAHGDIVRIGETTLRFVALCGADFTWGKASHENN